MHIIVIDHSQKRCIMNVVSLMLRILLVLHQLSTYSFANVYKSTHEMMSFAFIQRIPIHHTNSLSKASVVTCSAVVENVPSQPSSKHQYRFINPLGPPPDLISLELHDTYTVINPKMKSLSTNNNNNNIRRIKRLSKETNIFLLENFITSDEIRSTLIKGALQNGMKVAGTKQSENNTVRKKSYLTWIDPSNDVDSIDENVTIIANKMGEIAADLFIHPILKNKGQQTSVEDENYFRIEDLQIAKYDAGGCFNEHHDGFGRFVTVLTYLNGIGGTFFPYARTHHHDNDDAISTLLQSRDGLLVVGNEGKEYYETNYNDKIVPATIVSIKPGDAIVFYNYNVGERDLSSAHESFTIPCEKWIATNWIRSDCLTGHFAHLHFGRILEDFNDQNNKN